MRLFDDIKSPALLYLKGGLFLLLALMAAVHAVLAESICLEIVFLGLCVWASCRFYYFLFYVLDHYLGGNKNASIFAMLLRAKSELGWGDEGRNSNDQRERSGDTPDHLLIRSKGLPWRGTEKTPHSVPGSFCGNLMAELPDSLPEELTEMLIAAKSVRIERILSTGQASVPDVWYDQHEHEWVAVLKGEAALEFAEPSERRRLCPGDHVLIPAHQKHRVAWTSADEVTVWLAVFFEG